MNKIKKDDIDFDTTLVDLKFILKGHRKTITVHSTLSQCVEFIDIMNENKFKTLNKYQKEKMENKYFIFDDYVSKKNIMISFKDIRYAEIPFANEVDNDIQFKKLIIR